MMNLLSVGAAYGVMTIVAKGGAVGGLIGIDHEVPIAPFMPVMMFAILFGLSMDYEVFLISRIREEYLKDRDTRRAVADGLAKTARVITAAAAIMVVVFLAFLAAPDVFLKLFGIGLASAIFLDATLVRMVLVPAVMQLLGDRNWWIPSWLERILPRAGGRARRRQAVARSAHADADGARAAGRVRIGGVGARDGADRERAARAAGEPVARGEAAAAARAGALEVAPAAALARLQRDHLAEPGGRGREQPPAQPDRLAAAQPARADPQRDAGAHVQPHLVGGHGLRVAGVHAVLDADPARRARRRAAPAPPVGAGRDAGRDRHSRRSGPRA